MVADHVGTKSKEMCEEHYLNVYIKPPNKLPVRPYLFTQRIAALTTPACNLHWALGRTALFFTASHSTTTKARKSPLRIPYLHTIHT
jgi:hypothetical protein